MGESGAFRSIRPSAWAEAGTKVAEENRKACMLDDTTFVFDREVGASSVDQRSCRSPFGADPAVRIHFATVKRNALKTATDADAA